MERNVGLYFERSIVTTSHDLIFRMPPKLTAGKWLFDAIATNSSFECMLGRCFYVCVDCVCVRACVRVLYVCCVCVCCVCVVCVL